MSRHKKVRKAHPTVKTWQIFLSIFRMITYLNFAVIEGCTGPSTFWKVQFSNSVIYLLHICIVFHNLSVFLLIQTGKRKEKSPLVFTQGKGLKIDASEFSTRCFNLLAWGRDHKSGRVYFQTLVLYGQPENQKTRALGHTSGVQVPWYLLHTYGLNQIHGWICKISIWMDRVGVNWLVFY